MFAIRDDAAGGLVCAVTERAALRGLRHAKTGSGVYIAPAGSRELPDGRRMMDFVVYAQEMLEPAAPPVAAMTAPASASTAASPTAVSSKWHGARR